MANAPGSIPDLDDLATWCRSFAATGSEPYVRPSDLQRRYNMGWNASCSALEALEARGDLEKVQGQALAWKPAPAPHRPTRGYSLPLSPSEHGALLRLLDVATVPHQDGGGLLPESLPDLPALRQIRTRLKRGARP